MSEIINKVKFIENTWSRRRKMGETSNPIKRTRLKSFTDHRMKAEQCFKNIQRLGPSLHSLMSYADSLCNISRIDEALDVYATALEYGDPLLFQMDTLVKSLIKLWCSEIQRIIPKESNAFSCVKCEGVLYDPVTVLCGHSLCRQCYEKSPSSACAKCGTRNQQRRVCTELKTNVVMHQLTKKWWDGELSATVLRNSGNVHFKENRYEDALKSYDEAISKAPTDHLLYGNRSQTLLKIGKPHEALQDATAAIGCKPQWYKGHYRKGYALLNLKRYEDALVCFLYCAALSGIGDSALEEEIAKLLKELLAPPNQRRKPSEIGQASGRGTSSEGEDSYQSDDSNSEIEMQVTESEEAVRGPIIDHSFNISPHPRARSLLERLKGELASFPSLMSQRYERKPNPNNISQDDFECTLCYRLLWQPVTIPCGHTFCKCCLQRCLDHSSQCPLCKFSLEGYLEVRQINVTEFLDVAISTVLPNEYKARHEVHVEEIKELASGSEIPIFVCTLGFPTISCPLHVYEPRYRLMIRRAMETGTREFGMCVASDSEANGFATIGTMLEIRDVQFFPDGRSVVDTVGGRRFRVLRRGTRDGYATGKVEYLKDNAVEADKVEEVKRLHDCLRQSAESWLNGMPSSMRQRISQHFGSMPNLEADWITSPQGPAWHWWLLAILPASSKHQVIIICCYEKSCNMKQIRNRLFG
ncbi:hypothetical protein QYM36_010507 [Artemia franciscana]|uniref:LON peptidase N-terminal domain and RING finger protein 3 n=1 Tax=Artemia franciscana TaxID=6661 RepID=A0AA88HVL3_ARTSF|nr:hypothetical protein QYM36_010507 [Artemia franciscana]